MRTIVPCFWFLATAATASLVIFPLACNRIAPQSSAKRQFTDSVPNTSFTMEMATDQVSKFSVPQGATDVKVSGSFNAGSNVEILILNEEGFGKFRNGQRRQAMPYYQSDIANRGSIKGSLPGPGTYYVVFRNQSSFSNSVSSQINVEYSK